MLQYRIALPSDIPEIQRVRNAVTENRLSNPSRISDKMVEEFMMVRGRGWVCETGGIITGFAIADHVDENIWALFVDPRFEGQGIGKTLQRMMLDWYFEKKETVWLSTAPGTRAETFYTMTGWRKTGRTATNETKFEMRKEDWDALKRSR